MSEQNFYPQIAILHRCIVYCLWEEPINWTWLWLSICDSSIIMIGTGGLLLVVPTYMQFQSQFYWWGCQKKKIAKLRYLILLSRVTYWAVVEMLLAKQQKVCNSTACSVYSSVEHSFTFLKSWPIIMIGPGGLLLVVPYQFAVPVSVLWVGLQKST